MASTSILYKIFLVPNDFNCEEAEEEEGERYVAFPFFMCVIGSINFIKKF